jgi:hypothetical protein
VSNHVEFPELTPEAKAAYLAACPRELPIIDDHAFRFNRIAFAAFLREAVLQVFPGYRGLPSCSHELLEMANNLHSPPPPRPTLAQARAADLDSAAGRDVVRDFLATLGEGGQQ